MTQEMIIKDFQVNKAPVEALWEQFDDACPATQPLKVTKERVKQKWVPTCWGYKPIKEKSETCHFYSGLSRPSGPKKAKVVFGLTEVAIGPEESDAMEAAEGLKELSALE